MAIKDETRVIIKSRCCGESLGEIKEGPSNPAFGQSYRTYVKYYYCTKCGLMYKNLGREN